MPFDVFNIGVNYSVIFLVTKIIFKAERERERVRSAISMCINVYFSTSCPQVPKCWDHLGDLLGELQSAFVIVPEDGRASLSPLVWKKCFQISMRGEEVCDRVEWKRFIIAIINKLARVVFGWHMVEKEGLGKFQCNLCWLQNSGDFFFQVVWH